MDYSMDVVIKLEDDEPDCASMRSRPEPSQTFSNYKGGIRAASLGGTTSENGVYIFRIMDFLGTWGTTKLVSQTAQAVVSHNKVDLTLLDMLQRDLLQKVGDSKCKNHDQAATESGYCWSSCGYPCEMEATFNGTLYKTIEVAKFDFRNTFVKHVEGIACRRSTSWRKLCSLQKPGSPTPREIPLHDLVLESTKTMSEQQVDQILGEVDVRYVLSSHLSFNVEPQAPSNLKRIAVLLYLDFARHPFREDTVPPADYAKRFARYWDTWIVSPPQDEWESQCPP